MVIPEVSMNTDNPTNVLEVRNLFKSFDQNNVLKGIDLAFQEGRILGLMGENGAGKSTLMKICAGVLPQDRGDVLFCGETIVWDSVQHAIDSGIAFIHQELSVFEGLSVAENVFVNPTGASAFDRINFQELGKAAKEALAKVGADHIDPAADVSSLSIADRQSVEIARVLAGSHIRILIMDEPTSALTRHEAEKLFVQMADLAASGVSIIFISHRFNEVLECCDEVVVLRDGAVVSHYPVEGLKQDTVIRDMVGRDFDTAARNVPYDPSAPIALTIDKLTDGHTLEDISFEVRFGEVLGIYGLVGSGRTELLQSIIGQRRSIGSPIAYFDGCGQPSGAPEALRRRMVMVPENRKTQGILPNIGVGRNITYGVLARLFPSGFINNRIENEFAIEKAGAAQVRYSHIDQPIRYLSGGNQQKTILARAVAVEPRILLLDEPTLGVDVNSKFQIYETIVQLAAQGTAVIMVSSELPEVLMLSSRILVMSGGKRAFFGENSALNEVDLGTHAFRYVH